MKLLELIFGCWHKRTTFPLTARRGKRDTRATVATETYVVCLDCGQEFAYDWQTMRIVHPSKPKPIKLQPKRAKSSQVVDISTMERRARFR